MYISISMVISGDGEGEQDLLLDSCWGGVYIKA